MVERLHSLGKLGETVERLYAIGATLKEWSAGNVPDEDLIWKGGLSRQCRKVDGVAAILTSNTTSGPGFNEVIYTPIEPRVVGYHTSKSVRLPVTCLKFNSFNQVAAYVFIRDNFHDIKVCIISDSPMVIPYDLVHYEFSEERWEEEKKRYREYIPSKEKEAKLASGSDDWYKDWSSGEILRKDGRIFVASSVSDCYCEGINRLGLPEDMFQVFQDGLKLFSCSISSYAKAAMILEHVEHSLQRERRERCKVWNEQRRQDEARVSG